MDEFERLYHQTTYPSKIINFLLLHLCVIKSLTLKIKVHTVYLKATYTWWINDNYLFCGVQYISHKSKYTSLLWHYTFVESYPRISSLFNWREIRWVANVSWKNDSFVENWPRRIFARSKLQIIFKETVEHAARCQCETSGASQFIHFLKYY